METDESLIRFDELQRKLVPLRQTIEYTDPSGAVQPENTLVVMPSLTVKWDIPGGVHAIFEERFLFMLFLLRRPEIRMIYLTSQTVSPLVVDYYLHILPDIVAGDARKRLHFVAPLDGSDKPLVAKLLERPQLLADVRSLIPDPDRAHLVPFTTTNQERELAVRLDIPMDAADPRFFAFGTKSGGRRLFQEEGVQHPIGVENLSSERAMVDAVITMRGRKPSIERVITKLNEGGTGMGNAVVTLSELPPPGDAAEAAAVGERLRDMRFEIPDFTYDRYLAAVEYNGAVAEEFVSGEEFYSPSVQMRVSPLGEVQVVSTHDQVLGGPTGQSYQGAIFPANPAYSRLITVEAEKVGRRLAQEGVIGWFAIDFLTVRKKGDDWEVYAIEINLRKGGTTHPFLTLQYLTDGLYDPAAGVFKTRLGHEKFYVAGDHIESPVYRALMPDDVVDMVRVRGLHFDHTSQTGVVLHQFSGVGQYGRIGVTAIHNSPVEARALYERFSAALDETAIKALS